MRIELFCCPCRSRAARRGSIRFPHRREDRSMASAPFDQFDPIAYKARQREEWSSAAPGWRRRWPAFEHAAQPLSDRMIELAQIVPGQRVLDVATGIGEPAMTAARRVGA